MSAMLNKAKGEESAGVFAVQEPARAYGEATDDIDLSLLDDSLAKKPWERMQANDDALRFADSLRAAMQKRNAKS